MLNLQSQDEGEQSVQFCLSTHLQAKTDSWFQLWFQMAFRSESCLSSACQNSKVPPLQVIIRHDAPWWQLKWLSLLQKEMLQIFRNCNWVPLENFLRNCKESQFVLSWHMESHVACLQASCLTYGSPCSDVVSRATRLHFETRSKSRCEPKVSGDLKEKR